MLVPGNSFQQYLIIVSQTELKPAFQRSEISFEMENISGPVDSLFNHGRRLMEYTKPRHFSFFHDVNGHNERTSIEMTFSHNAHSTTYHFSMGGICNTCPEQPFFRFHVTLR
jgi:hypothetical protein